MNKLIAYSVLAVFCFLTVLFASIAIASLVKLDPICTLLAGFFAFLFGRATWCIWLDIKDSMNDGEGGSLCV